MSVNVEEVQSLKTLIEAEREHIRKVLHACDGNKSRAAKILDIDRRTLYRKIEAMMREEER